MDKINILCDRINQQNPKTQLITSAALAQAEINGCRLAQVATSATLAPSSERLKSIL